MIVALASAIAGACSITGTIGSDTGGSAGTTSATSSASSSSTATSGAAAPPFDKLDLLLVIDDTRAMGEKQQILGDALLELTQTLANPPCLDPSGASVADQPSGPLDPCPTGSTRQLAPILDMHVRRGSPASEATAPTPAPAWTPRAAPAGRPTPASTIRAPHRPASIPAARRSCPPTPTVRFRAWHPPRQDDPPGATDLTDFSAGAQSLALGSGESGLRVPLQLESGTASSSRPTPTTASATPEGQILPSGVDATSCSSARTSSAPLAPGHPDAQRRQRLLRGRIRGLLPGHPAPGSNGSTTPYHLPRRLQCAVDPNDPAAGPARPTRGRARPILPAMTSPTLDAASDGYGSPLLEPEAALRRRLPLPGQPLRPGPHVAHRAEPGGRDVNPIFSQVGPAGDAGIRDPSWSSSRAWSASPGKTWPAIPTASARASRPPPSSPATAARAPGTSILGDPDAGVLPLILPPDHRVDRSPHRRRSRHRHRPRAPRRRRARRPHQRARVQLQATPTIPQYACIFPLRTVLDCSVPGVPACDCTAPQNYYSPLRARPQQERPAHPPGGRQGLPGAPPAPGAARPPARRVWWRRFARRKTRTLPSPNTMATTRRSGALRGLDHAARRQPLSRGEPQPSRARRERPEARLPGLLELFLRRPPVLVGLALGTPRGHPAVVGVVAGWPPRSAAAVGCPRAGRRCPWRGRTGWRRRHPSGPRPRRESWEHPSRSGDSLPGHIVMSWGMGRPPRGPSGYSIGGAARRDARRGSQIAGHARAPRRERRPGSHLCRARL